MGPARKNYYTGTKLGWDNLNDSMTLTNKLDGEDKSAFTFDNNIP